MTNAEINKLATNYKKLQLQKDALEKEMESIKNTFKDEMGDEEVIQSDRFVIRNTTVTSMRFDNAMFKKMYGNEVYEQFCKPSVSHRFSIG